MSIATAVAPHLPYLRRFARALTGSQTSGDAYVVAVLEAFIEDPNAFARDMPARIALYRAFLKVWDSIPLNTEGSDAPEEPDSADGNLDAITPRPRQAFLLMALEGFSLSEAAQVLDLPTQDVKALIDQAGAEIAEQIAADILIIEDEPLIAMDLEALVTDVGHRVLGVARTHAEAVASVASRKPSLVLADIQLADGSSGLEAVNEILTTITVPVIFITAYPERLLTGQKPEPTFLITKPFQPETVKAVISQALFFDTRAKRTGKEAA
ncbi:MAG TPA: response regulator [Hyphomicrobiaceae bacterium]|jgi:DNA-directed RNA polymerase specialized sigma24 family protein